MDALLFVTFTEMLFYLDDDERAYFLSKLDAPQANSTAAADRAREYARQYVREIFSAIQPIPYKRGKSNARRN